MSTLQSKVERTGTPRNELSGETEQVVRRLFEEVYAGGELQVAAEIVTPDYVGYCTGTGAVYSGPAGLKEHAARVRSSLFELSIRVDAVHGTAERFLVVWTATGRLERPFGGIQPSCVIGPAGDEPGGPTVSIDGVLEGTARDGDLQEARMTWLLDDLSDP